MSNVKVFFISFLVSFLFATVFLLAYMLFPSLNEPTSPVPDKDQVHLTETPVPITPGTESDSEHSESTRLGM